MNSNLEYEINGGYISRSVVEQNIVRSSPMLEMIYYINYLYIK